MPRLFRIGGSFAIVLSAYWAYALVAVPLIEPPAEPRPEEETGGWDPRIGNRPAARVRELADLFPKGAWELKNPKILESDRLKLLMQSYRNLGDGRVEITPCTLVFLPEQPADDPAERLRRAVVLEARQGAVLRFAEPIDPLRGKIGRPVGGELVGPITIRSQGQDPGPDDDLLIVTRDVELTQRHIWTSHAVDFRWGRSHGRGRRLHIELLEEKRSSDVDRDQPNIAGIKLFELREIERIHLELGKQKPASGAATPGTSEGKTPMAGLAGQPVELSCRGPFRFDVPGKVATFKDRVDIWRVHPNGPSDQLSCELLTLYFIGREEADGPPARDPASLAPPAPPDHTAGAAMLKDRLAGSLALRLARIEARGDPVVASIPSERAAARGQRLVYDLLEDRIVLQGADEVMLKQAESEIRARSLDYLASPGGRLGEVYAEGPGWLRARLENRPDDRLEARWNTVLQVRPQQDKHVISLHGGAALRSPGFGQLDAKDIGFTLRQVPGTTPGRRIDWKPDEMHARGNVHVSSERLSCVVDELKVGFEETAPSGAGRAWMSPGSGERFAPTAGHLPQRRQAPSQHQAAWQHTAYHPPPRERHFEVLGRVLTAKVQLGENEQIALSELTIRDKVRLVETQTARPDEEPLSLAGDFVQVLHADTPNATATVTGRPAELHGPGLALVGPNVNLDRGSNRLWIDGAGRMDIRLDRGLEGRPLETPANLQIHFGRSMEFDGQTAQFNEAVRATAPNAQLETRTLEVQFQRPIRFGEAQLAGRPEIERVACLGGAVMHNRSFEGPQQTSQERIETADLSIHVPSGELNARGPGRVMSVRRGVANPILTGQKSRGTGPNAVRSPNENMSPAPSGATPPADQLSALHVQFQGSATGNLRRRDLTFHDRVQTAFAPVDGWDARLDLNEPDALPPGGVWMKCNRLGVHEMPAPLSGRRSVELEAAGNVLVEGRMDDGLYAARALRMTYDEAKGLLVLEGDGHTAAELVRQQRIGGPQSRIPARRILYWPATNRFTPNDPPTVEINGLPSGAFGGP
jgi:hypothetical protein